MFSWHWVKWQSETLAVNILGIVLIVLNARTDTLAEELTTVLHEQVVEWRNGQTQQNRTTVKNTEPEVWNKFDPVFVFNQPTLGSMTTSSSWHNWLLTTETYMFCTQIPYLYKLYWPVPSLCQHSCPHILRRYMLYFILVYIPYRFSNRYNTCLLYTSDAADE